MKILDKFTLEDSGLTGAHILDRLQRGHVVRRACWIDGVFIRICNEQGYDEFGHAIYDERRTHIYTISTQGYFLHLGYSGQPFRNPRTYPGPYGGTLIADRDGEGIGMLFARDWEDYGYYDLEVFRAITDEYRDEVSAEIKREARAAGADV